MYHGTHHLVRKYHDKDGLNTFVICTAWPGREFRIDNLRAGEGAKLTMLGVTELLSWKQDEKGLTIALPESLQDESGRPCRHAWAIRIPKGSNQ
jgi:hypothetical protein